jgi:hypothetical protein
VARPRRPRERGDEAQTLGGDQRRERRADVVAEGDRRGARLGEERGQVGDAGEEALRARGVAEARGDRAARDDDAALADAERDAAGVREREVSGDEARRARRAAEERDEREGRVRPLPARAVVEEAAEQRGDRRVGERKRAVEAAVPSPVSTLTSR